MKKLNSVVYNKLLLQAEEARHQCMPKLAKAITGSLTSAPEEESVHYGSIDLKDDVYNGLWKLATCVMKYHDIESVDAEKVNEAIEVLANKFLSEVETSLNVENNSVGPIEPKLLGQK